jgi:acetoacetyl-CoA synthetase
LADFLDATGFAHYDELYRWSITDSPAFWTRFRAWASLPQQDEPFNFAQVLLERSPAATPLWAANESGRREAWPRQRLLSQIAALQQWFLARNLQPGERVAAYLPNLPETAALMLAATSLGAIWSSCSPDFGASAVLDRFQQITPRFVFSTSEYSFNGKTYPLADRHQVLRQSLPGLEELALIEELPATSSAPLIFRPLPHNAPLFILFSSGTTGLPKCIVHSAGGTLVQILKELLLHSDVRPGERLFYYTTCGWMMWNWLLCGMAAGAELVLYDGSPLAPDAGVLWRLAEDLAIAHFGTSAKYLALLEKQNYRPRGRHNLAHLRQIFSTGSPLAPASFDFIAQDIGPHVHIASISGGTDIISCFVLGNPLHPVHRGEIQGAGLGMDVQVWNGQGQRIWDQPGELVCLNRFPSMPLGFWGDADGSRYRAAYFEHFPPRDGQPVWRHGDWAQQNSATGGFIIFGRSDSTLNPGGIRIGTAEIYRIVEGIPEILESVCVAQQWEGDERIVLFVRLREGVHWSPALAEKIRAELRTKGSPHHVPKKLIAVADIPRTVNGKISEAAVRDAIHGRPVRNLSALANPESTKEFQQQPELLQ